MSTNNRKRRVSRRGSKVTLPPAAEKVAKFVQPVHSIPYYDLGSPETIEMIHEKSMRILEEGGIAFYDDESQRILRANGVKVVDDIAYFDREMVMEFVSKAPSEFTQIARNRANNVTYGGDYAIFAPVYGPPYVQDYENGRREGTYEDLINFIKLTQQIPYLHNQSGAIVEPSDLAHHERHMDIVYAHLKYGDKPFMGASTMGRNAQDTLDMAKILVGEEAFNNNPVLNCTVNVSSPRRLDDKMLSTMIVYAQSNQITMVTPFILSGAMGPVSIAGTVTQLNAEVLASICFLQMINPGNPNVYGSFQAIIDLQSGAPVFGAPESQLAIYLSGQMARYYNIPFRSSGAYSSAKIPDAQAGYESVMAMYSGMQARPNFVLHAAGWLENGLVAGYEKFLLDSEMLGMYCTAMRGVDYSENGWAMDTILNEVPPGGHHLGTQHTMRNFRDAFYRAELFDYDSAESWEINGSLTSYQRAHKKFKTMLKSYEAPPLDPAIDEALQAFMAKRKAEIEPQY